MSESLSRPVNFVLDFAYRFQTAPVAGKIPATF